MLERDYHEQLKVLLANIDARVDLPEQYRELLANPGEVKMHTDERRRFARRIYPVKGILEVKQTMSGIARDHEYHVVFTKDFSRSGISFYHAAQLFPGERPILWLMAGKFTCTIVRCARVNKRCYDIGATFHKDGKRPQG